MKRYVWKEKIITIGFIAINIFLFVISLFDRELLYREGAFSLQYILNGQEWWRLITSMFLHADLDHLLGNMLMLYLAEQRVLYYMRHMNFSQAVMLIPSERAELYSVLWGRCSS